MVYMSVPVLCVTTGLCFFMVDAKVFDVLFSQHYNWPQTDVILAFRQLGKAWFLIWLLLNWLYCTHQRRPVLIATLSILLVAPAVLSIKAVARRPRPHDVMRNQMLIKGQEQVTSHNWSFPSGDTATVFAVATVLAMFLPWPTGGLFVMISVGVGVLRVFAKVHYPSDVLAGAAIGILSGWIALLIDQRWWLLISQRIKLRRRVVVASIVLLPVIFGLSEGIDYFAFLLRTWGVLTISFYLLLQVRKKISAST